MQYTPFSIVTQLILHESDVEVDRYAIWYSTFRKYYKFCAVCSYSSSTWTIWVYICGNRIVPFIPLPVGLWCVYPLFCLSLVFRLQFLLAVSYVSFSLSLSFLYIVIANVCFIWQKYRFSTLCQCKHTVRCATKNRLSFSLSLSYISKAMLNRLYCLLAVRM